MLSIVDFVCSLREHNARALDRLLLERYGGKVGRGLAVESSRRREALLEGRFRAAWALTSHTGKDESSAETGHNVDTNISLQ